MNLVKMNNLLPIEVDYKDFFNQFEKDLNKYYKGFNKWFSNNYKKILSPGKINLNLKRQFIVIYDTDDNYKLAGIILLKIDSEDQKVASLYISPNYRNKGIGTKLLKESFRQFNCDSNPYTFFNDKVLLDFPMLPYFLCKNNFKYIGKTNNKYKFIYQGETGKGYKE